MNSGITAGFYVRYRSQQFFTDIAFGVALDQFFLSQGHDFSAVWLGAGMVGAWSFWINGRGRRAFLVLLWEPGCCNRRLL
jgi:hypothetical protein